MKNNTYDTNNRTLNYDFKTIVQKRIFGKTVMLNILVLLFSAANWCVNQTNSWLFRIRFQKLRLWIRMPAGSNGSIDSYE